ncbi:MAG TPA: LLM class flavin-dependent oxidoreductase [Thermoleophilaceae bacterium]|nr:LLM class flavin-dependent oxidoreductase [Thermoleophilaceae bacterium]
MRIGIQLPEVERDVRWPEYVAMARAAEECGFDSIWLGDHLVYDAPERGPWEAWTMLSALAAVTERVKLGPLVTCVGFRPPGVLAKMAATADEVSGGRLVLAVGAGWNAREFSAFGIPFDHRVGRFEEAFAIVHGLLAGERVTFHGRFHSAEDAVLLPRPARQVPLMIGSNGPRMLAAALPHVSAWNTWYVDYGNTAEGFAALNARISEAAERAGRDPSDIERSACAHVVLDRANPERRLEVPPIDGADIAARVRELGEAGADEVILVAGPINERSIRALGDALGTSRT